MEKTTFKIDLADGSSITNLELNGNNFISTKKITEDQLSDDKLTKVTITGSDGSVQNLENQTLVQITKDGGKYWFVIRQLSEAEALKAQLNTANDAVAELSEIVASLMGGAE